MSEAPVCGRCGRPLLVPVRPQPGRRRRWCTDRCRRLASEERRAAESGNQPVRYVTTPLSLDDHVDAVLASPAACRRIVRQIGEWMLEGRLEEARWESVAGELVRTARRQAQRRRQGR